MSFLGSLKTILASVAPTIGSALGGPLGGAAAKALVSALGLSEGAKAEEIEQAIGNASPEQILKIKEVEYEFKIRMTELGLDARKIELLDIDSARNREVNMFKAGKRDYTPTVLAGLITIGFFSAIAALFFISPPGSSKGIIDILIGGLSAGWIGIVNYYFGSSAGSRLKDNILATVKHEQKP